jgi:hypothetical protein
MTSGSQYRLHHQARSSCRVTSSLHHHVHARSLSPYPTCTNPSWARSSQPKKPVPFGILFTLRPNTRVETSATKTASACRSSISAMRHSLRRIYIHSLDDVSTFPSPSRTRCDQSSDMEFCCGVGTRRRCRWERRRGGRVGQRRAGKVQEEVRRGHGVAGRLDGREWGQV